MARHLELAHNNEIEVAKILTLPKRSKERRKAWGLLVNKGDFSHNYEVLESGKGTIIPKYRVNEEEKDVKSFLPCQYCHGMYTRTELWRHQKSCKKSDESIKSVLGPVASGKKMLPVTCTNQQFNDEVLAVMRDDDIKAAVLSDETIKQYGMSVFDQQGDANHKHVYASQKMRELGRLLLQARKNGIPSIYDCLKKSNWDKLIISVKEICSFETETNKFGIPTLALKVGKFLENVAEDLYFQMNKNDDERLVHPAGFLELYKLGWTKEIARRAHSTLSANRYNCPKLLPLVEDVAKLSKYIEGKLEMPGNSYRDYAQFCLAQIILFNRKRGGEAERMTVKQLKDAKKGGNVDPVILTTLTEFEKSLCKTHLRVEIVEKRERKVPVILTDKMKSNIEKPIELRANESIQNSDSLFARPGSVRFPFRGVDALKNAVKEAGLSKPELITSTSLRKQLATMAQVLSLDESSKDLLATFQGHDIRVHRQFYRLPNETLQVAKITRLLHCLNNGTIGKYKGCDFDNIKFDLDGKLILSLICLQQYSVC